TQMTFNTKVADIEGNLYSTVTIGAQVWMAENLRSTKFNDNTPITNITDDTEWLNLSGAAYCWYDNNIEYKSTFGALYSWYTVEGEKICPAGWHVPTDLEFGTLEIFLGLDPDSVNVWGWRGTDQGKQMKSTTGWDDGGNGNNSSGFTGLPGGFRYAVQGAFYSLGTLTYWWSSSELDTNEGWYRKLDSSNNDVYRASTSKKGGKYIRCVKD
ncbi:MAG: fibrobacter succinogenes major paralogous domain-containing protein, partial [Bacteroidales bacterium]|nr:fibrobacter succinogenes major paralogous domain-containing protein [Bacteroidales bacterium]